MEATTTADVDEFFNLQGDWYVRTIDPLATNFFESLLPFLKLESATSVIEVGCGQGNGIPFLLEKIPEDCPVWAGDLNEKMLGYARKRGFPEKVSICQANAEELPCEDEQFDRYVSNLVLHLVESPQQQLKEAYRVMKPGGIAAFTVLGQHEPHNFFEIKQEAAVE